jgi:hypothetical protein
MKGMQEEFGYGSIHSSTLNYMEVTGHVHALVAVTPVTTEQEAGWVSAGN